MDATGMMVINSTSIFLMAMGALAYMVSGYVSIILCKKNTTLKKYFTKVNARRFGIATFFIVYFLFRNSPSLGKGGLSMPIIAIAYSIIYSLVVNLVYRRLKLKDFFNDQYYQCLIGTLLFTILNSLRVYYLVLQ